MANNQNFDMIDNRKGLTEIARQLKDTFEGFNVSEHQEELKRYRKLYGDAECIRIGNKDYIVINQVYKNEEYEDVPESTSPLFFNSINNQYAIIDAETSSTLIDEVYARVTYMQRVCSNDASPESDEVRRTMTPLVGEGETIATIAIPDQEKTADNKANIFQCQLIKDTGVSAAADVFSFMLKHGEIKEIPEHVMRQLKHVGRVTLSNGTNVLERNRREIQEAVFEKYINDDLDIQNINVKSIFEISLDFSNIIIHLNDEQSRKGVYHTTYLASEHNEFEALNANLHVCNACGHELVDIKDSSHINRLHINMDALDPTLDRDDAHIHAVGCEDCLVKCPNCGGWHYNYEKLIGSKMYDSDKVKLYPGRAFIRGLNSVEGNYCRCRECIEWVYDERSGDELEHNVIPIEKMAFVNYANEKIASYEDFQEYYEKKRSHKAIPAMEESANAQRICKEFKRQLAGKFDIDVEDISISSIDKCTSCDVCGGDYFRGTTVVDYGKEFRCDVCAELISEGHHSVTRIDGIVFMRHTVKKQTVISKYIVTKFGNLKEISSSTFSEVADETESELQAMTPTDETADVLTQVDEA